ncbi:MAG: SDR family NAD(P)-dependent oxidoreductase [Candidatus Saliniplasma sp.]
MTKRLKGKKALITGASRGIGRAIAKKFSEKGAYIGINYHSSDEKAKNVLDFIKKNSEAVLLKGDVSDKNDCKRIVAEFVEEFGGLDILVNNAGILEKKNLEESTVDIFDKTMGVNVRGPFMLSKYSIRYLKDSRSGRIINMSSHWAFRGSDQATSYVVSKAALLGLTRALALELGPKGITVNGIAPGTIETDMIESRYSEEEKRERAENIPVRRLGKPEDIAGTALFLASEEGSYVNGEVIGVNGGITIH